MEEVITKDLLLMMKDKLVMRINFDTGKFEVINEKLLPFIMQGRLRRIPDFSEIKTRYDDTQRQIAIDRCKSTITEWLADRVLPLTRDNAKKVYGALRLSQRQDANSKAKIALSCRSVSLQDNYWVKIDGDHKCWSDVNLRTNHLNEIVAQISLHGSSLTIQGELTTPELTGQGSYAKAWKREDGKLWLYKKGAKDPTESRIEAMVSDLLDKCNVNHLHYELAESKGGVEDTVLCCRCECMTTEDRSILPAMDYETYCNVHELNFIEECKRIDSDMFYKMCIVDYLIANRDRHGMNWGFFYDCNENRIWGMHPLYDHNNAFDKDYMENDDSSYQVLNDVTMKQAALTAMKHVDFHFTDEITRKDFITDRQYQTFMRRAKQLGVETKIDAVRISSFE